MTVTPSDHAMERWVERFLEGEGGDAALTFIEAFRRAVPVPNWRVAGWVAASGYRHWVIRPDNVYLLDPVTGAVFVVDGLGATVITVAPKPDKQNHPRLGRRHYHNKRKMT